MTNLRKLETELWESADLLRAESKLTSQEYCMPVLGLIFLRYAYSRFRYVEGEILKNRPVRNGRVMPVEAIDFQQKSALFLPEEARYEYLLNLPDDANVGEKVNHAMALVEQQSQQLQGVLPKTYTSFKNDLLRELLRIFNNSALNDIQDDIIGRIYEYFLNKFAPAVASDDGVFFTPKSLVKMIVNVLWQRRHVRFFSRFHRAIWRKRQHDHDLLWAGEGGVQRQTVPDEHGGAWPERKDCVGRCSQQLLQRSLRT